MMPVEWPLAASAADRPVDPTRPRAGRDRLGVAMADFFLDEGARLTDEERALIAAMLRGLIGDMVDELIAGLPALLAARAEKGRDGLYRRLRAAGLMERQGLLALLLRRADEQQLSAHADPSHPTLAALISDDSAPVAEAAMALALARGRRRDRFGRMSIEFDDLAAEDAVALAHAVAAALKEALPEEADEALGSAAHALLARHDEGRRLEATFAALARVLDSQNRTDDDLVRRLAEDGDASLMVGLLARRAGIDQADAWNFFTGGETMLLARLAGCERTAAAQMLAAFEPMSGAHAAERVIDRYDSLDDAAVERCRRWLRLDPHYRAGREALERADG